MKVKKLNAFTLPELMVVLVIIGILVLIALPKLTSLITRARSIEAQTALGNVYSLQQSYFYLHSKYADNLEEIGFEQEELVENEGTANYLIEIVEASTTGFRARATAVVDFDQDGNFNVWEIDNKKKLVEVVRD